MPKAKIVTYGCQMNEADSAQIKQLLLDKGFDVVGEEGQADLVLLNTCTVRRKAEDKVFGHLGHLALHKRTNPGLVIGVLGCMGASSRDEIESRAPWVDFVLPPHELDALAQVVDMRFPDRTGDAIGRDEEPDESPFRGFVNVMRGCNNNCTFCIVPMVRGREVCFPYEEIQRQVARLAGQGALEIWLLGQNVNSYRHGTMDFADLIGRLAVDFPALKFRFTSPHPKDFPLHLLDVLGHHANIAKHVHIPLQSGADRILRLMKRSYTRARFEALVARIRERIPGVTLSTDVICGFPGETEEEFEETVAVCRAVEFDQAYMFYYSPRQNTAAVDLPDQLPVELRKGRLRRLIDLQLEISATLGQRLVGQTHDVLINRIARKPVGHLSGHTDGGRTVIVEGPRSLIGRYVPVRIDAADSVNLFATRVGEALPLPRIPEGPVAYRPGSPLPMV